MTRPRPILFAGGGTGGHIFPNLAVLERLERLEPGVGAHFLVSSRPLDASILEGAGQSYTALPASPFAARPDRLARFARRYRRSRAVVGQVIADTGARALVATGGFVSGPAVAAAAKAGVPVALVNLDAVPGRANRWAARRAAAVFTAYAHSAGPPLPRARYVGFPLRESITQPPDPARSRRLLDLEPDRPTLLITAGSQGARSVNLAMVELVARPEARAALAPWQVLHLAGGEGVAPVREAYDRAGIAARVRAFCEQMAPAWSAADLALTRAGAGSVAEALATATPAVFLPYPFHKDQHQRRNAAPLVDARGAIALRDQVDPSANADQLVQVLAPLLADTDRRESMRRALRSIAPPDSALAVARWALAPDEARP